MIRPFLSCPHCLRVRQYTIFVVDPGTGLTCPVCRRDFALAEAAEIPTSNGDGRPVWIVRFTP